MSGSSGPVVVGVCSVVVVVVLVDVVEVVLVVEVVVAGDAGTSVDVDPSPPADEHAAKTMAAATKTGVKLRPCLRAIRPLRHLRQLCLRVFCRRGNP